MGNKLSALFELDPSSNTWAETKLTASDSSADDYFGYSVGTSGTKVIVGAYKNDDGGADSGSAYLIDTSD